MRAPESAPVLRRVDYRPPDHTIRHVDLRFELDPAHTVVSARLQVEPHPDGRPDQPLVLHGVDLDLRSVALDGVALGEDRYTLEAESLTIRGVPGEPFTLTTEVCVQPDKNTALEGLYASGGKLCTQCEAEGFRRITWFLDRPDVLATYSVTLVADLAHYPVLLANGNPVEQQVLDDGRHLARWDDPFPKPCYLFALVAGDLAHAEQIFTTKSGRDVTCRIYAAEADIPQCAWALDSLVRSMRWDEDVYGLECDLDHYNVVAVDDFNMGAMENKGLNIFNSKFVLADPDTATDDDYAAVEGVIAHEYFHNWTGNRVTCRDWFQLSLKEGLTVFRDQCFSADMATGPLKRIDDVRLLRTRQFPEDSGPMAHPVRPDEVVEINNFYTATVYEKGSEVVRMYHTLLGGDGFRKGMDLYFQRHDGQAVTCRDFLQAMADANDADLEQFERWYAQPGTPRLLVHTDHDPVAKTFRIALQQQPPRINSKAVEWVAGPLHIPVRLALLNRDSGEPLPLVLNAGDGDAPTERVLELRDEAKEFVFQGVEREPVLSVLRGYSAPVILEAEPSDEDLAFRIGHDGDPFNCWDASQELGFRALQDLLDGGDGGSAVSALVEGWRTLLGGLAGDASRVEPALAASLLGLPGESQIGDRQATVDVDVIHGVRQTLRRELVGRLQDLLWEVFERHRDTGPYAPEPAAMGRRSLANRCLMELVAGGVQDAMATARQRFSAADNMTDRLAAMTVLVHLRSRYRDEVLAEFHKRQSGDPRTLDKWFAIQATTPGAETAGEVTALLEHPDFTRGNPNRFRSLVGAFAASNPTGFHSAVGDGYRLVAAEIATMDQRNPQVAARLATSFSGWRRHVASRQVHMKAELEALRGRAGLSRDVAEVVGRCLD